METRSEETLVPGQQLRNYKVYVKAMPSVIESVARGISEDARVNEVILFLEDDNARKFSRNSESDYGYAIQRGCPEVLQNDWFAVNSNYGLVATGKTRQRACDWLEVLSLVLEGSRGPAVEHYESTLYDKAVSRTDPLLKMLRDMDPSASQSE